MILYTQCCPMSVFCLCHLVTGSIQFQVVPPANIWDGALCDKRYFWCCILLGKGIAQTVSSYEFLVFCVSLLLSRSCSRLFQVVLAHFRLFQLVQGGSSTFQVVPARFRWFQHVSCFSLYAAIL